MRINEDTVIVFVIGITLGWASFNVLASGLPLWGLEVVIGCFAASWPPFLARWQWPDIFSDTENSVTNNSFLRSFGLAFVVTGFFESLYVGFVIGIGLGVAICVLLAHVLSRNPPSTVDSSCLKNNQEVRGEKDC